MERRNHLGMRDEDQRGTLSSSKRDIRSLDRLVPDPVLWTPDKTTQQACKEAGIHTQTYYQWRKGYGGLKVEQAKRLKALEKETPG